MRRWPLLLCISMLTVAVACESESTSADIHPQPQPNRKESAITAPCTAETCGEIPSSIESPRCKPLPAECGWTDEESVSYRACADRECGTAPGANVCPSGTTFKGNACGSENEAACAWTTTCAKPPSTTPCADVAGCGGKPEIGVICSDGSTGDLACMQFDSDCGWQRTCD